MAIREEKEIKRIQIGKEDPKMPLFADDTILYVENPKDDSRKLLELSNKSGKVAGYKISTEKTVAFQDINNKRSGEIEQTYDPPLRRYCCNRRRYSHRQYKRGCNRSLRHTRQTGRHPFAIQYVQNVFAISFE